MAIAGNRSPLGHGGHVQQSCHIQVTDGGTMGFLGSFVVDVLVLNI